MFFRSDCLGAGGEETHRSLENRDGQEARGSTDGADAANDGADAAWAWAVGQELGGGGIFAYFIICFDGVGGMFYSLPMSSLFLTPFELFFLARSEDESRERERGKLDETLHDHT